jgi:HPt (histidine-containing phosphotransfer) domain-containing protein
MIDMKALDQHRKVMGNEADVFIANAINTYLKSAEDLISMLQDSALENDREMFERTAHILKSSSAVVGAQQVSALAAKVEHLARTTPLPNLAYMAEQMNQEFTKAAAELRRIHKKFR